MELEFEKWKHAKLSKIDLSRKGSVDDHVLTIVSCLNSLPQTFTTSSCSGRIILFENVDLNLSGDVSCQKKGCKWLYVTHEIADTDAVFESLGNVKDEAVFKFEPMVMHIQCRTLQDAQTLHQAAVASGFRNSGITVGSKGKIMVAVRSTHGLEAPISSKGNLLVSKEYIEFLVQSANKKMEENFTRIDRFFDHVKLLVANENSPTPTEGKKEKSSKSKGKQSNISAPAKTKGGNCDVDKDLDNYEDLEDGLTNLLFEDT